MKRPRYIAKTIHTNNELDIFYRELQTISGKFQNHEVSAQIEKWQGEVQYRGYIANIGFSPFLPNRIKVLKYFNEEIENIIRREAA